MDTPYDFPTKLGSTKWQSFKSTDEMYNACQIPQDILSKMSTAALIQTCLGYPASGVLLIHNTPQQGFNDWKQHFNGIQELLKRSDANEELLKTYLAFDTKGHAILKTDIEKGHYTFLLAILESIIVQDEITESLSAQQQKTLLKSSLMKYQNMGNDEVYGFSSKTSTGRIISKISLVVGNENLKAQIKMPDAQEYIKTGSLTDRQILLDIILEASKINTDE
jgi:hypothetical protein